MRVPQEIGPRLRIGKLLGFECDESGAVRGFHSPFDSVYPPPGFLRWNVLQVGNGDVYGYYWPLGRESDPPIVCTTLHDNEQVVPVASSIEGCLRLLHGTKRYWFDEEDDLDGEDEVQWLAGELGIDLRNVRPVALPDRGGIEFWGAASCHELLPYDPDSPHLLLLAAEAAVRREDFQEAECLLHRVLTLLPEYTAALFALAQVYRRKREVARAIDAILETFTSINAFGGSSEIRGK